MLRRTKIVATLGPASDDPKVLDRMMEAGMRTYNFDWERWVARLPQDAARAERIERLLLAMPAVVSPPPGTDGIDLVRNLTADPAYQLK